MHLHNTPLSVNAGRRKFLQQLAQLSGSAMLAGVSIPAFANTATNTVTTGQIMDKFIAEVPGGPFDETVDTLKSGSRDAVVTGVVTTMFPTITVIHKAISLGANFIICHEPSFYNHADDTKWLADDETYKFKRELLDQHRITIWRNHDYIHRHTPDGVFLGVLRKMGWEDLLDKNTGYVRFNAPLSLKDLIQHAKRKLGIDMVRYIGNLSQSCKNAILLPGAAGGRMQIGVASSRKPDVLICGEIAEWETAEYIRDTNLRGQKTSLIVLGHALSEEPGSAYMADWIKKNYPGLAVTHVPAENPLAFL